MSLIIFIIKALIKKNNNDFERGYAFPNVITEFFLSDNIVALFKK